jgi:hypothetical protein
MERALELTPEDDTVARARRLRRLGEILAFSADMQTGAATVAEAVDLLRAEIERESSPEHREAATRGYARAAASLGEIQLEQLRFADTRALVNEALERVAVEDEGVVRLLILRGHATVALENDVETGSADSARALGLARRLEDPALELEAQAWLARMHIPYATALVVVDWARVERFAKELGRWSTVAGAIESQAMHALVDDRPNDVFPHADRLTEPRGRRSGGIRGLGRLPPYGSTAHPRGLGRGPRRRRSRHPARRRQRVSPRLRPDLDGAPAARFGPA